MAIYAVVVDAGADASRLFDAMKVMDSFRAYPNLWFVSSAQDTSDITMHLAGFLPEQDRLFVSRMTDKWVSIRTADAAAWLNARGL